MAGKNKSEHLRKVQGLALPLTDLKGIGAKRAASMAQKGLYTILDLLFFTPIRYEDRTRITPIDKAEEGIPVLTTGKVVQGGETLFFPSRKRIFSIGVTSKGGSFELLWFNYRKPYLTKFAVPGTKLLVYGRVIQNRGRRQIIHPDVTILTESEERNLGFYPIYSAIQGISLQTLRSVVKGALNTYITTIVDPIPNRIIDRLGLPDLREALEHAHFPPKECSIDHLNQFKTPFQRRLVFDRFFLVMLIIAMRKRSRERESGPLFSVPSSLLHELERSLGFSMTAYQVRAIEDMVRDFAGRKPMNRLLLGDVGCGKTAVAVAAAYISVCNNCQVAVMVPTQVLANQHMDHFLGLADDLGFRPVLLTGRLKSAERRDVHEKIGNGSYNVIIGTQALIQDDVSYHKLGLVVIDEQHRFGVKERALVDRKGENPHQLIMTATPIPRTLAISIYGDMDISTIRGYPGRKKHVATHLVSVDQKRMVFDTLQERLSAGQQAFVICPVIGDPEETDLKGAEEMAERLKKIFDPKFRVGLIHGRLSPDDREKVMDDFRKGRIDLLVGTTVIEVGVHVPNATVMIIEHPERFGLAQLHQLRGRIGRGEGKGICFLMLSNDLPGESLIRLETLRENHDGFKIAEKDLELRGHGELIGMRQAGVGELDLTEIMKEPDLLFRAKLEAQGLIDDDPDLLRSEHRPLKIMVESVLSRPLDL